MQNGLEMFTNSLHMIPKKLPSSWWQTPSRVHISCAPKRLLSYQSPFLPVRIKHDRPKGCIFSGQALSQLQVHMMAGWQALTSKL